MTRKEALAALREDLMTRREAIRMALLGDMSLLNELASQTKGDIVDWALESAQDELSSQLAEVEGRELAMVENALKRMSSGDYGDCEVCETQIPLARLQALPYATLCIQCQRAEEISGGTSGREVDWSRVVDYPSDDSRARSIDINVR